MCITYIIMNDGQTQGSAGAGLAGAAHPLLSVKRTLPYMPTHAPMGISP